MQSPVADGQKRCRRCKHWKAFGAFYVRSGITHPTEEGHYISECKACLKERSRTHVGIPKTEARHVAEQMAIARLNQEGIAALPGKAVSASNVDVVAWGHVWIEIKYSTVRSIFGRPGFSFSATPQQKKRGFLAHVVILVCDYGDNKVTYHLFDSKDPVFYRNGKLKVGFTYMINSLRRFTETPDRIALTTDRMEAAKDRWNIIEEARLKISAQLKT